MRALLLPLAAGLALAACSNAAADAEKELAIVEKSHGSPAEICAAKRKVADAYLARHDQEKYEAAKLAADSSCLNAQLEAQYPSGVVDNLSELDASAKR